MWKGLGTLEGFSGGAACMSTGQTPGEGPGGAAPQERSWVRGQAGAHGGAAGGEPPGPTADVGLARRGAAPTGGPRGQRSGGR